MCYEGPVTGSMPAPRYIIQLDLPPAGGRDLGSITKELREAGVEIDADYHPVCINPKLQRFVVRGVASVEARDAAEKIGGIQFFADSPIQAAKSSGFGPAV